MIMTQKIITIASAAALMLGAAFSTSFAQDEPAQEDPYAAPPAQEEPTSAAPSESAGGELVGQAVFDANGQQVGTVAEIATDETGSEVAVLSVGEFLGLGAKQIAVATTDLQPNADGTGLTIALTAEDIEAAPEYEGSADSESPEESPE